MGNMDIIYAIRSVIFFIPGLLLIIIPDKVFKFQIYLIGKFGIKYYKKPSLKSYPYIGIIFIIISIMLLVFSIFN